MININGLSLIFIVAMLTSGLGGWFLAKEYYMDASTEVLVESIKHMSPRSKKNLVNYILQNKSSLRRQ